MYLEFDECTLCPRSCKVNRNLGQLGFCCAANKAQVCKISLHQFEEPVISKGGGSGTIFFTHCNLGCIYCQNFEISRSNARGKIYSANELAKEMLKLQKIGANNINFVTPTHYLPIIKDAVIASKKLGLTIPTVYNTSGYENKKEIENLKGIIDIFLTDLKYYSPYYSKRYSITEDYFDYASESIKQMITNTGTPYINSSGLMQKGVIIRHLMLPGLLGDTKQILKYISKNFGDKVLVSLMRQYTPINQTLPDLLTNKVTDEEYDEALLLFEQLGLEGFAQDKTSVGTETVPKWDVK